MQLWSEAAKMASRRWEPSTQVRVDQAAISYVRFVMIIGLMPWIDIFSTAEVIVLLWAAFLARTNTYDSVKKNLSRLRSWFRGRPSNGPLKGDPTQSYNLEVFLQGLRKENSGKPKRKKPITPQMRARSGGCACR